MIKIEKRPSQNGPGKIANASAKNQGYNEPHQRINILNRIKK
jgi:hypothetical protein